MKKLCIAVAVISCTYVWAGIDWGVLGFPSYNNTARDALSKFDMKKNSKLAYVFGVQKPTMQPSQPSHFSELLAEWDAKGDWQTSRGTLQVLWQRAGTKSPEQGWPSTRKNIPTLEDLTLLCCQPD